MGTETDWLPTFFKIQVWKDKMVIKYDTIFIFGWIIVWVKTFCRMLGIWDSIGYFHEKAYILYVQCSYVNFILGLSQLVLVCSENACGGRNPAARVWWYGGWAGQGHIGQPADVSDSHWTGRWAGPLQTAPGQPPGPLAHRLRPDRPASSRAGAAWPAAGLLQGELRLAHPLDRRRQTAAGEDPGSAYYWQQNTKRTTGTGEGTEWHKLSRVTARCNTGLSNGVVWRNG